MKQVVIAILILFSSIFSYAQSDDSDVEKKVQFGFNLGVNYANLHSKKALPTNMEISNGPGFRLGLLSSIKFNDVISLWTKGELAFNQSKVLFSDLDNSTFYKVMPISLEFAPHLVFTKKNGNLNPFVFIGPSIKLPVEERVPNTSIFPTGKDFAVDFGIGLNKALPYFNFAPELRYSYGLLNINKHPAIQTLNFHSISLIFNFIG